MTYYVCFRDNYEFFLTTPEDMLPVEAETSQAAIEKVLRDGNGPANKRLRCAMATTVVNGRKDLASVFWIDFDGQLKRRWGEFHWPRSTVAHP